MGLVAVDCFNRSDEVLDRVYIYTYILVRWERRMMVQVQPAMLAFQVRQVLCVVL